MDKLTLVLRLLLGLMMVVFGLNKFLNFIPMTPPAGEAGVLMAALFGSGYLMKMVAVVEIASGLSFLLNKYAALGAVILFPVMINAFMFHLVLDPAGIGGALVATGLNVYLLYSFRDRYREILKA